MRVTTKLLQLSVAMTVIVAATAHAATKPAIHVLSNRSDLVSGGDVLVQVAPPAGVPAAKLHVRLNGNDVTKEPGIGQQPTIPWQTYQKRDGSVIYGGRPLGPAPAGSGSGWMGRVFRDAKLSTPGG
jgi:hypothetical protein